MVHSKSIFCCCCWLWKQPSHSYLQQVALVLCVVCACVSYVVQHVVYAQTIPAEWQAQSRGTVGFTQVCQ
jgi:hypothetical protein